MSSTRQAAEDRGFLRQIADAEPRALVHRQSGDVGAVEIDAALVGLDQAGDHVEHGRLAGAVGAEQADRLAFADVKADALHHFAADEAFLDAVNGKKPLRSPGAAPLPSARRRGRAAGRGPFAEAAGAAAATAPGRTAASGGGTRRRRDGGVLLRALAAAGGRQRSRYRDRSC